MKETTTVISGKRKTAVARATLTKGTGKVTFNGVALEHVRPELARLRLTEPLVLADDLAKKVDIEVKVIGGGITGQADAGRLAIAKALVAHAKSEELEKAFLSYDRNLLVADVRRKETRKPNDSKARAKRQKSYR